MWQSECTDFDQISCGLLKLTQLLNCMVFWSIWYRLVKGRSVCLRMRPLTVKASKSVTRLSCVIKERQEIGYFEGGLMVNCKIWVKFWKWTLKVHNLNAAQNLQTFSAAERVFQLILSENYNKPIMIAPAWYFYS